MLDDFLAFLQAKRILKPSQRPFYVEWISGLFRYSLCKDPHRIPNQDEIDSYLAWLSESRENWQVQQARDAIRLYLYFKNQSPPKSFDSASGANAIWSDAIDRMVQMMRLKHLAFKTEQTYVTWMRQFYRFVNGLSPLQLGNRHVIDFLTYLAVERKVAKATQNQAFNSLLFFFRHVLNREISDVSLAVRSRKKESRQAMIFAPYRNCWAMPA